MSQLLSTVQKEELHKSILGYVIAHNRTNTATALREELQLGLDKFNTATADKYGQLLEKKWSAVVRLEEKAAKLEARHSELESKLEYMIPASKRQDPAAWLPTAQPTFNLESHSSSVNCIAFHPVFSSLASGSDDCTIKIWDWELGGLERTIKAHTLPVRDLDFGGHRNTILLASCSTDRAIKLWDPTDNYKNIRTLMGHEHAVTSVRFLPGNERNTILLVSASADRTIRLWDATTGYCVQTLQGHGHWVRSVSPSDDGRLILSASSDKTACLWDIKQNTGPIQTLIGHDDVINCCAFAPLSAHQHISSLAGVSTAVHSSSFSEFFATGSRDKTIKLWNASGTCLKTLLGHDSWVTALVFHPGGKYIFSVAEDKTLRIWDLSQNGQCISVLPGVHGGFITCLRWAPSAKNMRVQNEDGNKRSPHKANRLTHNFAALLPQEVWTKR